MNTYIPQDELGRHLAWERFLSGHWTRERPKKPGYYPVEGVQCGETNGTIPSNTVLVHRANGGELHLSRSWDGWWCSEPLPNLPSAPDAAEAYHGER